jgi:hypothetical protein
MAATWGIQARTAVGDSICPNRVAPRLTLQSYQLSLGIHHIEMRVGSTRRMDFLWRIFSSRRIAPQGELIGLVSRRNEQAGTAG